MGYQRIMPRRDKVQNLAAVAIHDRQCIFVGLIRHWYQGGEVFAAWRNRYLREICLMDEVRHRR